MQRVTLLNTSHILTKALAEISLAEQFLSTAPSILVAVGEAIILMRTLSMVWSNSRSASTAKAPSPAKVLTTLAATRFKGASVARQGASPLQSNTNGERKTLLGASSVRRTVDTQSSIGVPLHGVTLTAELCLAAD